MRDRLWRVSQLHYKDAKKENGTRFGDYEKSWAIPGKVWAGVWQQPGLEDPVGGMRGDFCFYCM